MRAWIVMLLLVSGLSGILSGCYPAHAVRRVSALRQGPISVSLTAGGRTLPLFTRRGKLYVLGERGVRYQIRIQNHTRQRLEVFVAVDGRDVITGRVARPRKQRGYILNPYRYVSIPGFRTSQQSVAAFRFSTPGRAYAAYKGSAGEIGQIRVLVYQEKSQSMLLPRLSRNSTRQPKSTGLAKRTAPPRSNKQDSRAPGMRKRTQSRRFGGRYIYRPRRRPGLGTAFGRRTYAPAQFTTFHRASHVPMTRVRIRYDNCAGLGRRGILYCYKPHPCDREPCFYVPLRKKPRYATPPVR